MPPRNRWPRVKLLNHHASLPLSFRTIGLNVLLLSTMYVVGLSTLLDTHVRRTCLQLLLVGAAAGVLLEKCATVSRCSVCAQTETETGWVDSKKGCEVYICMHMYRAYLCTVRTFVVCRRHNLSSSGDRCLLSHRLPHLPLNRNVAPAATLLPYLGANRLSRGRWPPDPMYSKQQ